MYKLLFRYYKYLLVLLFIYLLLIFLSNIFNFTTFFIILIILSITYTQNKKLFKKIAYKIIFKNKNSFYFKNKYGAAKNSLKSIDEINKKISNKVDAELLKYEKNKL